MKIYCNTKGEFFNKRNGEHLLYFPHTSDSGLAQCPNRCIICPKDISLDIGICLHSDVNVLSNKK